MNTCSHPSSPLTPPAPPAPTLSRFFLGFGWLLRLAGPAAADLTHLLYTDRPELGSTPRTTWTHYR